MNPLYADPNATPTFLLSLGVQNHNILWSGESPGYPYRLIYPASES
jgi:hypothetical protein